MKVQVRVAKTGEGSARCEETIGLFICNVPRDWNGEITVKRRGGVLYRLPRAFMLGIITGLISIGFCGSCAIYTLTIAFIAGLLIGRTPSEDELERAIERCLSGKAKKAAECIVGLGREKPSGPSKRTAILLIALFMLALPVSDIPLPVVIVGEVASAATIYIIYRYSLLPEKVSRKGSRNGRKKPQTTSPNRS